MRDEDDEPLPWLEPAESDDEEDEPRFPYRGLIIACAAVVGVVALLWFLADRFAGQRTDIAVSDEVPLIQAPEGPYKVRPENPGGLEVDTDSLTHSVAEGEDTESQLAMESLPEEPVPVTVPPPASTVAATPKQLPPVPQEGVKRPPTPQPKMPVTTAEPAATPKPTVAKVEPPKPAAPKPEPAKAEPPKAAPPKSAGSATVQFGAFNSAASADQVWAKLAGAGAVSGLTKTVQPVEVGGKTLYRLRAGGVADSASVCAKVKAAGEQCVVVR